MEICLVHKTGSHGFLLRFGDSCISVCDIPLIESLQEVVPFRAFRYTCLQKVALGKSLFVCSARAMASYDVLKNSSRVMCQFKLFTYLSQENLSGNHVVDEVSRGLFSTFAWCDYVNLSCLPFGPRKPILCILNPCKDTRQQRPSGLRSSKVVENYSRNVYLRN